MSNSRLNSVNKIFPPCWLRNQYISAAWLPTAQDLPVIQSQQMLSGTMDQLYSISKRMLYIRTLLHGTFSVLVCCNNKYTTDERARGVTCVFMAARHTMGRQLIINKICFSFFTFYSFSRLLEPGRCYETYLEQRFSLHNLHFSHFVH
jgi:hypothetical protein